MTSQQRPHEGQNDRAEESDRSPDDRSPMEKFESLTRSIIGVTREQIREQERKYQGQKTSKHKRAN